MRIFITGGTGFIGTHVVERLMRDKHRLLLLLRDKRDAKKAPASFALQTIQGDIADVKKWKSRVKKFKPDIAIHLAWDGIPDYGAATSIKNLVNGLAVIQMLAEIGCKKILVSGSCWEYGLREGRVKENAPTQRHNAFAAAKDALYILGRMITEEYGSDLIWMRFFYVYGPGQKSHSLIPYLLAEKKKGTIPELKNPNGANDFIYVGDVADALARLIRKGNVGVYNIGSGRLTPVARIMNTLFGRTILSVPKKAKGFWADISKIKRETGWRPKTPIAKGIQQTINES